VADDFIASLAACIFENATINKFTALSISSMHMNTMMALRRTSTPIIPMVNNVSDNAMYALMSIIYNFTYKPTPLFGEAGCIEKIS
jgi:hypothetical protein